METPLPEWAGVLWYKGFSLRRSCHEVTDEVDLDHLPHIV